MEVIDARVMIQKLNIGKKPRKIYKFILTYKKDGSRYTKYTNYKSFQEINQELTKYDKLIKGEIWTR